MVNYERKMITHYDNIYDINGDDNYCSPLISFLYEKYKSHPDARIGYIDYEEIGISYERLENDNEYNARIASELKEEEKKNKKRETEYQRYLKLKAKYEKEI